MHEPRGLSRRQTLLKRGFDIVGALLGLMLTGWIMIIAALVSRIDTGLSGFFGRHAWADMVNRSASSRSGPCARWRVTKRR